MPREELCCVEVHRSHPAIVGIFPVQVPAFGGQVSIAKLATVASRPKAILVWGLSDSAPGCNQPKSHDVTYDAAISVIGDGRKAMKRRAVKLCAAQHLAKLALFSRLLRMQAKSLP